MPDPTDVEHGIVPSMIPATKPITQAKIDAVVATVRHLCGWHVWPVRKETITVDSPGDKFVFLPTKRLLDVHEVKINGETIAGEEFQWSADGVLRLIHPPKGFRIITVTITHGYETAPDLANVCVQMSKRTAEAHTSMQVGGISVGASQGITPQSTEWRIIDMYKLGPMP